MTLADIPLLLMLVGLAAYVVLGGADFGAGLWYMALGGTRRRPLRDHTYHAMGPVWEANHVWLIFVLVVAWTAYPTAFGSIASTLYVPLFLAALGIILRGTAYALRGSATGAREEKTLGVIFGASSALTPFALGAAVGGIASGRVPVGNAAGDPFSSWLNPTSLLIGVLSVATSAYLAAVWLTADGARTGRPDLVDAFRRLALVSGVAAGALAVVGLPILRSDARPIFDGLTTGAGVVAVLASAVAGGATLLLVFRQRLEPARYASAIAVATIVAGWALAQQPDILPGLTIHEAAASNPVITALLVSIGLGAAALLPSLALLFTLVLRGRFDSQPDEPGSLYETTEHTPPDYAQTGRVDVPAGRALVPIAGLVFVLGATLTFLTTGGFGRVAGVVLLLAGVACGWAAMLPEVARAELSPDASQPHADPATSPDQPLP